MRIGALLGKMTSLLRCWPLRCLRDRWRGYSDADVESLLEKWKEAERLGKTAVLTENELRALRAQLKI